MDATNAGGARKPDRRVARLDLSPASRPARPGRAFGTRTRFRIPTLNEPAFHLRDRSSVLIEFPAHRTRIEDVRERARVLAATGHRVAVVIAGLPWDPAGAGPDALPDDWVLTSRHDWRDALRDALDERPGAGVVCAGSERDLARVKGVAGDAASLAWPVRLDGGADHDRAALDWAVAARAAGISARSTLWDGDYLLVPGTPDDATAGAILSAFARLAITHPALDLVFLGTVPDRAARALRGTSTSHRVHAAGEAPLRAECAWLAGAAAVILPGIAGLEASLLVRALAAGTPVVLPNDSPDALALGAWLDSRGARLAPAGRAPAGVIASVLSGDAGARAAVTRGQVWARDRDVRAIASAVRSNTRSGGTERAA